MKNYRAYIMNEDNTVTIHEGSADSIKEFKASVSKTLASQQVILNAVPLAEPKERKERVKSSCKVTYVTLVRNDKGLFELKRDSQIVEGTSGVGKNYVATIRWFAKQGGQPLPEGALIETVETING